MQPTEVEDQIFGSVALGGQKCGVEIGDGRKFKLAVQRNPNCPSLPGQFG